jgi:hypothetical protein
VITEELSPEAAARVAAELGGGGGEDSPRAFVVAPALAHSMLKHQMGDIDEAIPEAQERLDRSLEALRAEGVKAEGEVGDSDPVQAISDELAKRGADRIVLVTHARDDESAYAEKELLERVSSSVDPPATELRVAAGGGGGGQRVEESRRAPAGADRGFEGERSSKLPGLRTRDGLGLLVGILGTVALIFLAGDCASDQGSQGLADDFDSCALRMLLAGGAFLVNLGHLGALLMMQSVDYHGPFERFFARVSLFGTPIAVLISLLLG